MTAALVHMPVNPGSAKRRRIDVFLRPGDHFVGDASHRLRTLLGSCVSVTLWCERSRIGAMSHFLLASRGMGDVDAAVGLDLQQLDGRYGDEALRLMLHELARRGVEASRCQAKIFGGGNMFPAHTGGMAPAIGRRNGEAARELLQSRGIEIVSESLFGDGHRQIVFDIDSGDVWARQRAPVRPFNAPGGGGIA
jgi:chemotaxis protein CheD